jgi:hypothetical protein
MIAFIPVGGINLVRASAKLVRASADRAGGVSVPVTALPRLLDFQGTEL